MNFRFTSIRPLAWLGCILLWAVASLAMAQSKPFTLVIDPGHGGKDAGAVGKLTQEKTINLNVALALGALIEQNHKDVKVIYTRKTDVFVPLDQRARIANTAKADLFLSIHTNAVAGNATARGAETYTLGMHRAKDNLEVAKRENSVILHEKNYKTNYAGFDPSKAESYIIFELMQDQFMKQSVDFARKIQGQYAGTAQRKNKGVHQAGFLVLRATSMPSVLTELGFISTPDEEAFLHSADGVRKLALSLYNAFVAYKNEQQGKTQTTTSKKNAPVALTQPDTPTPLPTATAVEAPALADSLRWRPTPIDSTRGTLIAVAPIAIDVVPPPATTPTHIALVPTTAATVDEATTSAVALLTSPHTAVAKADHNTTPTSNKVTTPSAPKRSTNTTLTKATTTKAEPASKAISADKITLASKAEPTTKAVSATKTERTTPNPTKPTTATATVEYRVQIMATSAPIPAGDKRIADLKALDHYTEGGLYKYTIGHATTEAEANKLRATLTTRFPQCFVIALRDGKRITLAEARTANKK